MGRGELAAPARRAGGPDPAVLGPLPANARAAVFLPHDELLPHTVLMVANGGAGALRAAALRVLREPAFAEAAARVRDADGRIDTPAGILRPVTPLLDGGRRDPYVTASL